MQTATDQPAADPADPRMLRTVLGRFATGVTVVTTTTPDGEPVGMTVNSFTSVSLDPPLVLFCVARRSCLYPAFATTKAFAVNILRESQRAVSSRFASPGFDRFDATPKQVSKTGVPLLESALAIIECATHQRIAAGDHDIIIGRVLALDVPSETVSDPLLFFAGSYRSLNTEPEWWSLLQ
jgi:3-hydroxy-9,10-secoandrosta-1,3,5(10)-triene-9,17-dione monooxygenase reductase component